mgnify:CR=1 FL=1
MKTDQKLNMTMLCDFYELTMGNGYLKAGFQDRITYFDVYFRSVPDGGGYAIAAGLDQLIDYIEDLHFDQQDIDYLRGRGIFCEEFLDYLANFHFSGDIYAVPEARPSSRKSRWSSCARPRSRRSACRRRPAREPVPRRTTNPTCL